MDQQDHLFNVLMRPPLLDLKNILTTGNGRRLRAKAKIVKQLADNHWTVEEFNKEFDKLYITKIAPPTEVFSVPWRLNYGAFKGHFEYEWLVMLWISLNKTT